MVLEVSAFSRPPLLLLLLLFHSRLERDDNMEPEDLPSPDELEEEEREEEEEEEEMVENKSVVATADAEEAEEARTCEETMRMEEFEEAGPEADLDFYCEFQQQESTDEEEDEMAKIWLQAHPGHSGAAFPSPPSFPPPPSPLHLYAPVEHLSRTEVRSGAEEERAVGRSGTEVQAPV